MTPRYLLVTDFDGTAFNTFEESPNGIGVHKAYDVAIERIFGKSGLKIYKDTGGLKNGAPEEIIDTIFEHGDSEVLLKSAENCFDEEFKTLDRLVPQGKGAPLEWIRGDKDRLRKTISELLVLIKMSLLYDEIGKELSLGELWPRPCRGFIDFFHVVENLRAEGIDIQIAILSSGHEKFIQKTFKIHNLAPPEIIVSDDDLRGRAYPETVEGRVKPSSFIFDLVHERWISNGVFFSDYARHIELIMESRKRMMYFGDDIIKDGGLAKNAGVKFAWFDSQSKASAFHSEFFHFANWESIGNFFSNIKVKEQLKGGVEISKIKN